MRMDIKQAHRQVAKVSDLATAGACKLWVDGTSTFSKTCSVLAGYRRFLAVHLVGCCAFGMCSPGTQPHIAIQAYLLVKLAAHHPPELFGYSDVSFLSLMALFAGLSALHCSVSIASTRSCSVDSLTLLCSDQMMFINAYSDNFM